MPLLAEVIPSTSGEMSWVVVLALVALSTLVLQLKQLLGGNKGERQIEPTSLAAITTELGKQTLTLNKLDREMGEVKTSIGSINYNMAAVAATQVRETENAFRRINAISIETAGVSARVEGLESREAQRKTI